MKTTIHAYLAILSIGALVGCAAPKRSAIMLPQLDRAKVQLPVKLTSYRELYNCIAGHEDGGVPADADLLFKLAADSETQPYVLDHPPHFVWVITPHFYNGGIYDKIRGATGNGEYYVLRPLARDFTSLDTDCGFELIGVAEGNTLRWSSHNGKPRFITTWHVSAAESPESVYEWNGKFFEAVQSNGKE